MKRTRRTRPALPLLAALAMLLPGAGGAEEGASPKVEAPKKRILGKAERERIEAWESLSPEQREKLRQALRQVWADPAVVSAREEIKHAGDAFQAAIKSAVERADPSMAEILAKLQGGGMGPGGLMLPGGPVASGGNPMRGFDEQIRPPGFLESLPPGDREKFRKAEEAAMRSEAVEGARAELARLREEDEALRRKRLEAHRKLRKVAVEEMIRIDPSIAPMEKRLLEGGKGNHAEKKKNPDGKEEKAATAAEPKPPGERPE